ncbi:MAG TPA: hypothetical protein ENI27_08845 [bacterium]|nr:hypothetical protein [bacterium]
MSITRINCPNCRQPIQADVEQLFDVGVDPTAKQKLLSGTVNFAECHRCGFQGSLATPIVYHDPQKELLLTFVPPEIGLPHDDQERLIGRLINQIMNNLPQEKRKGYLLQPHAMLTLQSLMERILESEGVTREMLQAQEKRMNLVQRLLKASEDVRVGIAQREDNLIDADFFNLLNRLMETTLLSGDEEAAQRLTDVQQGLLPITTFGRQLQAKAKEMEAAVASLQEVGEELTREKLLELVIKAPNDDRLGALVSLARPGIDYTFFQLLTKRIDRARGGGRTRLITLRERLLEMTSQFDQQIEARLKHARQLLDNILQAKDISESVVQSLPSVDEFFVQELNTALEAATKKDDRERLDKLQKIIEVIQQVSATGYEIELIEELLEAPDDYTRRKKMDSNRDRITPEFVNLLTNLVAQVESEEDKELAARMRELHRLVLRFSMEVSLKGS